MDGNTLNLFFPMAIVIAAVFAMFIRWQQQEEKREQRRQEREERNEERIAAERNHLMKTLMRQQDSDLDQSVGIESGGYIFIDIPDAQKSMFHDLLKGFEDYARLRGYKIAFSIDSSFSNKIAFKFTLPETGATVTTKQVRQDIKDYIKRVRNGEPLDDLPVILPDAEHDLLITAMKNRINFLQHSYNLQKNASEFYESMLRQVASHGFTVTPPHNFYIQAGDGNQVSAYQAHNSPQANLGIGNKMIGNRLDQRINIHIARSFNERNEQVSALQALYWVLLQNNSILTSKDKESETKALNKGQDLVRKALDELKDEDIPDPTRMQKWLETAKSTLSTLSLTDEVVEAAKKVWEAFNILS